MSFNIGYFIVLKTSATRGGRLSINHIDGPDARAPRRGLVPRGQHAGSSCLSIFKPLAPTHPIQYPVGTNFSDNGIAIVEFLYDHSVIPRTVSAPGGIFATQCRYSIADVLGHNTTNADGLLLHFSNVTDFSRTSRQFITPLVSQILGYPVPTNLVDRAIGEITTKARRLAAIINSMSRPVMAGVIIL